MNCQYLWNNVMFDFLLLLILQFVNLIIWLENFYSKSTCSYSSTKFVIQICSINSTLNHSIAMSVSSLSLLRVVLQQVVGDKFNWVSRSLLGALGHGLEENGHDSFIKVCAKRQVLHSGVLSRSISGCIISGCGRFHLI